MHKHVVIGAGITGLTCAYELRKRGGDVVVLEARSAVGGKISTVRDSGYLLEAGPNSLRVDSAEIDLMLSEIGLADRAIEASPNAKKRFILKDSAWLKVPSSPIEAISTPLFSLSGKLRVLAEPFIARGSSDDESIQSFITRRLGGEVFAYAADPFVTGIYAGDTARLSMRHTFPSMWRAEREAGSLIRGSLRSKRKNTGKQKTRIISFPNGLGELTAALKVHLGGNVRTSDNAIAIEQSKAGYRVVTPSETIETERVIFASPAYETAVQIRTIAPRVASALDAVDYPPIAVVYLGFRGDQFATPIEGFGGLIPSVEHRKILGVIFSSSNFPGRAPEGYVLLTVLLGGARNQEVRDWTEQKAIEVALAEVDSLLPHTGSADFTRARIWDRAIPQYPVGYQTTIDRFTQFEHDFLGLYLVGNYRGGISMTACMRSATELAKRLVYRPFL